MQIIHRTGLDTFYILRRDLHNIVLHDLEAALSHLEAQHSNVNASVDSAIEYLGCEAIECDDQKLEQNNQAAIEAFENGEDGMTGDVIRYRAPSSLTEAEVTEREDREMKSSSINPFPGQVYSVYWRETKQWLDGTLLPLHGLDLVDTHESVEKTDLLNGLPACYEYDSSSKSFSWARDYEDDGARRSGWYFAYISLNGGKVFEQSRILTVEVKNWLMTGSAIPAIVEIFDRTFCYEASLYLVPQPPLAESSTDPKTARGLEIAIPNTILDVEVAEESEPVQNDTDLEPWETVEALGQPDENEQEYSTSLDCPPLSQASWQQLHPRPSESTDRTNWAVSFRPLGCQPLDSYTVATTESEIGPGSLSFKNTSWLPLPEQPADIQKPYMPFSKMQKTIDAQPQLPQPSGLLDWNATLPIGDEFKARLKANLDFLTANVARLELLLVDINNELTNLKRNLSFKQIGGKFRETIQSQKELSDEHQEVYADVKSQLVRAPNEAYWIEKQIALVTARLDQLESERVPVMKEKEGIDANRKRLAIMGQVMKPGWQASLDKCDEIWRARVLKAIF
ncbi:hypothetical protein Forpe1208_v011810 [Fusarium oxysporum f. sp. rapae]|uniref:Uncharacterized protein n=1 Tax=Fusarium oxysporum f. sp. rapae TaxID=485398 RepID=A0A8J5P0U3_FUSOX|nr:hypothetical protein Forpe1208_v011810 [Fusarium oxysporum f. sp. rapae]